MATYTVHHDCGHQWVAVPIAACIGKDISNYSYRDRYTAYLETDSDAALVVNTDDTFTSVIHEGDCFIRNLARF
jgi:hypothetical protein